MYKQSCIKRISCILLTLLLCLLTGCTAPVQTKPPQTTESTQATDIRPHLILTATEAAFDMEAAARVSVPDLGLENMTICDMTFDQVCLSEATLGQVFLLGHDRGIQDTLDHYLLVQLGDKVIAKDLQGYEDCPNYDGYIETRDFDGDGDCEILVQECVGMIGGCGSYLTRVFDVKDGQLVQLFSTDDLSELAQNKYGFTAVLLEDAQYKIEHATTGYSESFSLPKGAAEYFAGSSGGQSIELEIDSFYEVVLNDVDGDDIAEICCTQYSWYAGHADGLGDVKTVWKYNPDTKAFEIIRTSFEAYIR